MKILGMKENFLNRLNQGFITDGLGKFLTWMLNYSLDKL